MNIFVRFVFTASGVKPWVRPYKTITGYFNQINKLKPATPPAAKCSAPCELVDAVVDEVVSVGRGWREMAAVDE